LGWKLRIYPQREPVALLKDGWEEYRESSDTTYRALYYNRCGEGLMQEYSNYYYYYYYHHDDDYFYND